MKFDSNFRRELEKSLIQKFETFRDISLEILKANSEGYSRVAFEQISSKKEPYEINIESCIDFMLSSKQDIGNLRLGLKISNGKHWWNNDVFFPFVERFPEPPEWGTPQFLEYRQWRDDLEYECEAEFWLQTGNVENNQIFALDVFENKIFRQNERNKMRSNKFAFLTDNWLSIVNYLLELNFGEFRFSEKYSTKSIRRFLLEVSKDIWLGFEFDVKNVVHELKRGTLALPEYLNLILINSSFQKNENSMNYYYKEHLDIMSLGILGNPFFYQPCYQLIGFSAVDTHRSFENNTSYLIMIRETEDGGYEIVYPSRYSDRMKKHAYFYYSLLAETSRPYINYIQRAVGSIL